MNKKKKNKDNISEISYQGENRIDTKYFIQHPQYWKSPLRIIRDPKKISILKLLSFKPRALNNLIDFLTIDDIFQMLQLNKSISNILLNTNLIKVYFNIRKEFNIIYNNNKKNKFKELLKNSKNIIEFNQFLNENKKEHFNFDKFTLSQLLNKNCELIRKMISRLKLPKNESISVFGKIIERQIKKELFFKKDIDLSNYNFNNEGIIFLNCALRDIKNIISIKFCNNTQIRNYHLISNITNWSKRNLQVLNLINNSLDDKSGILIFTKIKNNCPFLKVINLSENYFSYKTFESNKVKDSFKTCFPNLEKFIFKNNILGSKGAVLLFESLINCKKLILVDISYNGIEKNVFNKESVINFFNPEISGINYLYSFYYNGNFLPPSETASLIKCIINNNILTYLFIGNCQLNDESLELLNFLIINNQYIHSLFIHYNNFTSKGLEKLLNNIELNSRLIELNLSNNKLNHNSLKILIQSLLKNKFISSLNLSYNDFSKSESSDLIIDYIESNSKLKNINLTACHIGLGLKKLLIAIENNKKISCIDLSVNDIGGNKEVFVNISNLLKNNFYLRFLYLDSNYINDNDLEILICDGIKYNKNLSLLSLKGNRITLNKFENKDINRNIIECLKINDHIKDIIIDENPISNEKNYELFINTLKLNGTRENREYIKMKYS